MILKLWPAWNSCSTPTLLFSDSIILPPYPFTRTWSISSSSTQLSSLLLGVHTREVIQRSDRAQSKRQIVTVKEWRGQPEPIAYGGSGMIFLEQDENGEDSRVVKQNLKHLLKLTTGVECKLLASFQNPTPRCSGSFLWTIWKHTSIFLAMERLIWRSRDIHYS